jgi:hypothetical protein
MSEKEKEIYDWELQKKYQKMLSEQGIKPEEVDSGSKREKELKRINLFLSEIRLKL